MANLFLFIFTLVMWKGQGAWDFGLVSKLGVVTLTHKLARQLKLCILNHSRQIAIKPLAGESRGYREVVTRLAGVIIAPKLSVCYFL